MFINNAAVSAGLSDFSTGKMHDPLLPKIDSGFRLSRRNDNESGGWVVIPIRTVYYLAKKMKQEKHYYVYIMANRSNGTLYTGVTNDLVRRVNEHRSNLVEGFTKRYGLHKLVHFEETNDIDSALNCEKRVKNLSRAKKLILIENTNPQWDDLWNQIIQ